MTLSDDWDTGSVQVNGVDLQYYRTGAGPPLVMAHGFYDNGRCFPRLAADLSAEYEVITYDARAHGRSDAPESGYAIEDRAADLVGLLDALDVTDPVLFGHSMGATTVAAATAEHPNLARGIVLEDPAGIVGSPEDGPKERASFVRNRVAEWAERSVDDIAAEYAADRPDRARELAVARTECRPEIAEIAREGYPYVPDYYPEFACPALVLRQDEDPAQRREDLAAAATLDDGRVVHLPDAGHCVFRDQYDAAWAELRTFLLGV